jgi:AraC-like DNA-binding protein/ligand-binding sensor protein
MESGRVTPNRPTRLYRDPCFPKVAEAAIVEPNLAQGDRELLEALVRSKIFADYQGAFSEATGLPLSLRSVQSWQLPHHGHRNESPFCALMAVKSRSCGACLAVMEKLSKAGTDAPHTMACYAGLRESAVPVRLGDRLIGFLQTGQLFCKVPTERQFQRTVKLLAKWGMKLDRAELRKAYFETQVVPGKQFASVVKLLNIFAKHLSMVSNQLLVYRGNTESPVIAKAKAYIQEHHGEKMTLNQVAKAANSSRFHFCKIFRVTTGLNFTDYVSRVRTERAMNLLLNPNLRVSEIAYEAGFQSTTHFNRTFKRKFGQTPTRYRSRLWGRSGVFGVIR